MKKMRLLLVLTTILLSSRFVMAQVSLDLKRDYETDYHDFAAVADSILASVPGGPADINQDGKVNVMDITTMYNRIYNTRYFWFGNPRPTASDYTTKSGLAINKYFRLITNPVDVNLFAGDTFNHHTYSVRSIILRNKNLEVVAVLSVLISSWTLLLVF